MTVREYIKDRRADDNFRMQGCNINSKTSRNKKHQAAKRRKLNPEHGREIEQHSLIQKTKSREPTAHKADNQTVGKKKTKGWGSGKCIATNMQQSWVAATRKQIRCNLYGKFVLQKHCKWPRICVHSLWPIMWFKCSVVKCDPNKYRACSLDIVESFLTGFKSVNDNEWICMTCNKKRLKKV